MNTLGIVSSAVVVLNMGIALEKLSAAAVQDYWDRRIGNPGLTNDAHTAGEAVWAIEVSGSSVVVGGQFTSAGGIAATNVARWDGSQWSALSGGLWSPLVSVVSGVAVVGDKIYAVGSFDHAGSILANNIAAWDGTKWEALGTGLNFRGYTLRGDGTNLYVGGLFTQAGGVPANYIAKWDGATWSSLGTGVAGTNIYEPLIHAIAVRGSNVAVGGAFNQAGGVAAQNVALWDGVKWSALGSGLPPVLSLAFHGSELYAGGSFRIPGTESFAVLAKWTGSDWLLLTNLVGDSRSFVLSLTSVGSDLYVGAQSITLPDGADFFKIAADGETSAVGGGIDSGGGIYDIRAYSGSLFIAGGFTEAGGVPAKNIALWQIPRTLVLDRRQNLLELSWPAADHNLVLQAAANVPSTNWASVQDTPAFVSGRLTITNRVSSTNQFYRLQALSK